MNLVSTAAGTPLIGAGGLIDSTPPALRPVLDLSLHERCVQERIIVARAFHEGYHDVRLTARLRQFLGPEVGPFSMRFNMVRKINRAIAERLVIDGFDVTAANDAEKAQQLAFANTIYDLDTFTYIHVCGRDARLEWLDAEPRLIGERVYFPGDELPTS